MSLSRKIRLFATTMQALAQGVAMLVSLWALVAMGLKGSWIGGLVFAALTLGIANLFAPSAEAMAEWTAWCVRLSAKGHSAE